jgi:hypothetical protein
VSDPLFNRLPPADRYRRDPHFAVLVDTVYMQMLEPAHYTPTELREAVMLAAIMFEDRRTRSIFVDHLGAQITQPPAVYDSERFRTHRARTDVDLSWVIEELRLTAAAIRERGDKGRPADVWLDEMAITVEARMVQLAEGRRNRPTHERIEPRDVPAILSSLAAIRVPPEYVSLEAYLVALASGRVDHVTREARVAVHPSHRLQDGQCQACMILVTERGISDRCACPEDRR